MKKSPGYSPTPNLSFERGLSGLRTATIGLKSTGGLREHELNDVQSYHDEQIAKLVKHHRSCGSVLNTLHKCIGMIESKSILPVNDPMLAGDFDAVILPKEARKNAAALRGLIEKFGHEI